MTNMSAETYVSFKVAEHLRNHCRHMSDFRYLHLFQAYRNQSPKFCMCLAPNFLGEGPQILTLAL